MKKIILIVGMIAVANAGKVTWVNGKPIIQNDGEMKGCYSGGLNSIDIDNNSSKSCK